MINDKLNFISKLFLEQDSHPGDQGLCPVRVRGVILEPPVKYGLNMNIQ